MEGKRLRVGVMLAVFGAAVIGWVCRPLLVRFTVAGITPLAGLTDPGIAIVAALSLFYAAFIAEVFRAGLQLPVVDGLNAGRAIGLSGFQIMRRITLPQAFRNMFPALANDLIALMKDTSLLSVIAVRELTMMARLYTGSSFRFREGFFILAVMYVILTLSLSLVLRRIETRMEIPGR